MVPAPPQPRALGGCPDLEPGRSRIGARVAPRNPSPLGKVHQAGARANLERFARPAAVVAFGKAGLVIREVAPTIGRVPARARSLSAPNRPSVSPPVKLARMSRAGMRSAEANSLASCSMSGVGTRCITMRPTSCASVNRCRSAGMLRLRKMHSGSPVTRCVTPSTERPSKSL
jgi:hypothetical protein